MYKRIIKKIIFGTDSPQEYICTGLEEFSEKFCVALSFKKNNVTKDITEGHVFLGYKPLVIAIPVKKDEECYPTFISSDQVCMSFQKGMFKGNAVKHDFVVDRESQARLFLKKIAVKNFGDTSLFILEGIKGEHYFLSSFHQFANGIFHNLKKKGTNNVGLPGNLYEQVRIAYAMPRIISIISVGDKNKYNMFPTDLHGPINDMFYASSLRYEGKACKQVEEIKKITISNVSINAFRDAYTMGKNHMQDLKHVENFKVNTIRSEKFNYPLNTQTLSYREMELIHGIDAGIHRLLFYKIINTKILNTESATLSHIHQYYEMWRKNQGLKHKEYIR